jgi:stage IV sporulation protein B
MKPRSFRHLLIFILLCTALLIILPLWQIQLYSADQIRILKGESYYVNLNLPFLYVRGDRDDVILLNGALLSLESSRMKAPYSMEALELGQVNLEFSLFGKIPLRHITVNVLPEVYLLPGGHSIGIKLNSQGVAVVGFYYFEEGGKSISPAREAGVRIGDTIIAINGEEAGDVNEAAGLLEKAENRRVTLLISRNGESIKINVNPVYSHSDGSYRIGLYIRDSAAGVGTLSFYNPETKHYGALGHVILDADTNKPVNLRDGTIVKAKIIDIKAAQRGQPGEKTGIFMEHDEFSGNIEKNTPFGIFGIIEQFQYGPSPYTEPIPMALASQVEIGPAEILTVVEGEEIASYQIEIEKLTYQTRPSDKGIIVRVVDEYLIEHTGGIVQGMSGSPIIQKGKLVGAITHVFVNDPTRGYGIFMEWMHQEAEILTKN